MAECPHKDRNTRVCLSVQLKSICHIDPAVSALCDLFKNFNDALLTSKSVKISYTHKFRISINIKQEKACACNHSTP